jgi:hypothetical protein
MVIAFDALLKAVEMAMNVVKPVAPTHNPPAQQRLSDAQEAETQ